MAISLGSVRKSRADKPPRLILYGPQGCGKTDLACDMPDAIFIQTEDGVPADREINTFGVLETYEEVVDALRALSREEHDFKTVVVDTLDRLEPLVHARVCAEMNWSSIEDPGFGKGYIECDPKWRSIVKALNYLRTERGMMVVLIGHSEVTKFQEPGLEPYSTHGLRLQKRAVEILSDEVDAIGFMNFKTEIRKTESGFGKTTSHAEGGGMRHIYWEKRPGWMAKNRYGWPADQLNVRGQVIPQLAERAIIPTFPPPNAGKSANSADKSGSRAGNVQSGSNADAQSNGAPAQT